MAPRSPWSTMKAAGNQLLETCCCRQGLYRHCSLATTEACIGFPALDKHTQDWGASCNHSRKGKPVSMLFENVYFHTRSLQNTFIFRSCRYPMLSTDFFCTFKLPFSIPSFFSSPQFFPTSCSLSPS